MSISDGMRIEACRFTCPDFLKKGADLQRGQSSQWMLLLAVYSSFLAPGANKQLAL